MARSTGRKKTTKKTTKKVGKKDTSKASTPGKNAKKSVAAPSERSLASSKRKTSERTRQVLRKRLPKLRSKTLKVVIINESDVQEESEQAAAEAVHSIGLLEVEIDGEVSAILEEPLLSIVVESAVNQPTRARVKFENWGVQDGGSDYLYFDRDALDFGQRLVLRYGPDNDKVFDGFVTGLEGVYRRENRPSIVVHAVDRLAEIDRRPRSRTHEDVSFKDVAQQIASDYGMSSDIQGGDVSLGVVVQLDQTDYELLVKLADMVGLGNLGRRG